MSTVPNPPKLPPPEVAVVDTKTGRLTKEGRDFFTQLVDRIGKLAALS